MKKSRVSIRPTAVQPGFPVHNGKSFRQIFSSFEYTPIEELATAFNGSSDKPKFLTAVENGKTVEIRAGNGHVVATYHKYA